jgi:hypothetical protein
LVFEPLARKVWGDPKLLSPDLAQARIPSGGAAELILRLLKLKKHTEDLDAPFFYYPKGGFGCFPEKLAQEIVRLEGEVLTSVAPVSLERDGAVTGGAGPDPARAERLACETSSPPSPSKPCRASVSKDAAEADQTIAAPQPGVGVLVLKQDH